MQLDPAAVVCWLAVTGSAGLGLCWGPICQLTCLAGQSSGLCCCRHGAWRRLLCKLLRRQSCAYPPIIQTHMSCEQLRSAYDPCALGISRPDNSLVRAMVCVCGVYCCTYRSVAELGFRRGINWIIPVWTKVVPLRTREVAVLLPPNVPCRCVTSTPVFQLRTIDMQDTYCADSCTGMHAKSFEPCPCGSAMST